MNPPHRLRYRAQAGDDVRSLHSTSAGKALLGGLNKAALAAFLKSDDLTRLTPKTIVSKAALETELDEGNKRGWFLNREESQEGIITLSARFVWISTTYIVSIAGAQQSHGTKARKNGGTSDRGL